jgi:UDP-N-acetylmuramate--alanine ligase
MVKDSKPYFLVGIGGSGMLPLALILNASGAEVEGSDRALDQGRTGAKFDYLRAQGIRLHRQDGGGVVSAHQIVVASAAVEESVPDIVAARRVGAKMLTRAELLAQLFNAARIRIGVAGTSGKSTTTAMIGFILDRAGLAPTVMNGAVMKNYAAPDAPFASAIVGSTNIFVSELDESDGSIALFNPTIAVLNNVSLDHKSIDELRALFGDFLAKAETAIVNLENPEAIRLAAHLTPTTYSTRAGERSVALAADGMIARPFGVSFTAADRRTGEAAPATLQMPGRHNISNALAAIGAATAAGVPFRAAVAALADFRGVKRRLELVGEAAGVVVIDDFAHNPDKIAASLSTLHEFPGRLLVMFQPHGYGPLRKMKAEFAAVFAEHLAPDDVIVIPEPAYFGGAVDRSVSSGDVVALVEAAGRRAKAFPTRAECGDFILREARPGDRIIVMGARDDTLSEFALGLLMQIRERI